MGLVHAVNSILYSAMSIQVGGEGDDGIDVTQPATMKRADLRRIIKKEISLYVAAAKKPQDYPALETTARNIGEVIATEPWLLFSTPDWVNEHLEE